MMKFDTTGSLAIDAQGLTQLRAQAKQNPDQALKAAAQQFESVFMNMMLKSMREATPQESLFDNDQSKLFTSMLDQQLTQNLASRGIGLADMMVRQLSNQQTQVNPTPPTDLPAATTQASTPTTPAVPSAFNSNTQQNFVNKMLPHAMKASQNSGVPAQLILGQAALESGWGKREIRMPDGSNSFNLFGIKANAGWNGKVAEVMTTEYRNGVAYKQVEKFRAYDSYEQAFSDYANLLGANPRYASVLKQDNTTSMAQAVQKAGYATDPHYADKLAKVMAMIGR